MVWSDFFKLFTYAFTKDPLGKKVDTKELIGVAYSQPESIPQAGMEGNWSGSAGDQKVIRYRETNDFIDLSTVTNRISRYKEYERLRNVPEIEMAMTVISDEACISGDTPIALPHGFVSIKELAETKGPKERFLVYCWDFEKHDYTLGWAFHPRKVKRAETIKLVLDDGTSLVVTPDHEILDKNGEWYAAEDYKFGDELMPFYRESPYKWSDLKTGQFPRIYTHQYGWVHERHFVDEWRFGKLNERQYKTFKAMKMFSAGSCMADVVHRLGGDVRCWKSWIQQEGFTTKELKILGTKKKKTRRIVGIHPWEEVDVYDMSVEKHKCFCTDSVIVHNCQKDDDGDVVKIECENEEILEECNFVLKHRDMININARAWTLFKSLCIHGDLFLEVIINPENPKEGIYKAAALPPDSIYRIETTKGKVVEFQQSNEGPDYEALSRAPVTQQNDAELRQATALRFTPEQIVHMKFGDDRKTFYPYGISLIEPARGPAHQTRLMEESMIVYRLTRAPERRVFYIDVGQLPPFKAEAYIDRLKDQFRKKKTTGRSGLGGAHQVEERWQAPAADEDIWVPIRPNANTRIETLPGACLDLNTKIPLLDGTTESLIQIISRFNKEEDLWAYSCDPYTGKVVPGKITWAGITRKNTTLYRIKLDNGKHVDVTEDHKFPILGKGYVKTSELSAGDRLIPFHTRKNKNYVQVYDVATRGWKFTHKLVAEFFCGVRSIKHIDGNQYNNNPSNLAFNRKIKPAKIIKQTIKYPKELLDFVHQSMSGSKKETVRNVNENQQILDLWIKSNSHIKRKIPFVFNSGHMNKMLRSFGYKNWNHFLEESKLYNHKIVSIEKLPGLHDTGTLTIDGNESLHGYHTFALDCGVFTKNSNLGEIDDAVYFRNKLFTALNFPKNYFSNEDPNTTRITLSAQDVKFARMIERLQSQFEGGLWEILNRHLILRGFPPESYQDLKVSMTPPSDWRELSRAEVWGNRLNWASTLKGSQLMADWDLYVKILKYTEVEADEMISRLKLQKIEDLKLQIIAQNPRLLGIGIPGQDAQPGQELGTEAGGPTPSPMPEGLPEPMQEQPPPENKTTDQAGKPSDLTLPDPNKEDITKYDLEIQGYASEIDYEEPDYSIGFE